MIKKIKQLVVPNLPLKVLSLVGGYVLWSVIAQSHMTTVTRTVPVCVYNNHNQQHIDFPETVLVTLQALRHRLYTLDLSELAIHIDASRLSNGHNPLPVNRSTLFLPEGINVVHYTPSNAVIKVT